ncbi:23201_t:CDS:2 [Dentiscutata erythropus]|uniref:23201_t:CDS:1 n=1 Tax=Dentiscutata erythropus TaxID=1348616 RepID=A0A9N9HY32_9GLOM|nr:23201_t:CDS:2 [Dentiscutata erythropus]
MDNNNSDNESSEFEEPHITPETFIISLLQGKLTAVNLRIDYQFRGPPLEGVCLYDYALTIQKIPANQHELSIISEQHLRSINTHQSSKTCIKDIYQKTNEQPYDQEFLAMTA